MANSEAAAPSGIVPLTAADLPGALALSASAHWNQNEADGRTMLRLGRGWGIHAAGADGHATLAASTVVLPYGIGFACVSMVLVLPEFQRRGYASLLLRHALDALAHLHRPSPTQRRPRPHRRLPRPLHPPLQYRLANLAPSSQI